MRGSMQYRWVSYQIGQGGEQVEIEKCGAPQSTWTEFLDSLPDEQCRYGGVCRPSCLLPLLLPQCTAALHSVPMLNRC